MVNTNTIEAKLNELSEFFGTIKGSSAINKVDRETALYGFNKVQFMKGKLDNYRKNSENRLLKQIHGGFSSVTRGVEGFDDFETEQLFREKCKGIYEILKDLESNIKW